MSTSGIASSTTDTGVSIRVCAPASTVILASGCAYVWRSQETARGPQAPNKTKAIIELINTDIRLCIVRSFQFSLCCYTTYLVQKSEF